MEEIQFATRLARERQRCGLTQEQVAARLGVTKAAVSKWERGQSLPDMAQMPKIASLFAITLDELFGYEPQLTHEEVSVLYGELLSMFATAPDEAYRRCRETAVRYWSCSEVLFYLGMILYAQATLPTGGTCQSVQDVAAEYAEQAVAFFERVEALAPTSELARRSLDARAMMLCYLGRSEEATALLEPLAARGPSTVAATLSGVYREQGDDEAAARTLQRALLVALLEAQAAISGLLSLYRDDARRLAEVVEVGEALGSCEATASCLATLLPTTRFAWAASLATQGEEEAALDELERFAEAAERSCALLARPSCKAPLFDQVDDLTGDASGADDETCRQTAASVQTSFAALIEDDERFAPLRDYPRFQSVLKSLGKEPDYGR